MRLEQDGSSGFVPHTWEVAANEQDFVIHDTSADNLSILRIEAGAPTDSLKITDEGMVVLGGDLSVASSRELKRDFVPAPTATLLEALRELELYTWTYKADTESIRHLGPVAEDFHRLFQLGSDPRHVSPTDTAGLALAAIQELVQIVDDQNATLEAWAEAEALRQARFEALETRLAEVLATRP